MLKSTPKVTAPHGLSLADYDGDGRELTNNLVRDRIAQIPEPEYITRLSEIVQAIHKSANPVQNDWEQADQMRKRKPWVESFTEHLPLHLLERDDRAVADEVHQVLHSRRFAHAVRECLRRLNNLLGSFVTGNNAYYALNGPKVQCECSWLP